MFARFRSAAATTTVDGVRLGDVVATRLDPGVGGAQDARAPTPGPPDVTSGEPDEAQGSNTWAVAPARTAAGHALLFQNPHVSFYGSGQRYEVHLQSDQGWHFSGFAILGTPMPRAGHNEHLGWSHTNSAADVGDAYEIAFDAADSLAYRHGAESRRAIAWEDTLLVRTAADLIASVHGLSGPALAERLTVWIEQGLLAPGTRLPTIEEVATASGLGRSTVAGTWALLVDRGLVQTRRRGGTIVVGPASAPAWPRAGEAPVFAGWSSVDLASAHPTTDRLPDLLEAFEHSLREPHTNSLRREAITPALLEAVRRDWPFDAAEWVTVSGAGSTSPVGLIRQTSPLLS